MIGKRSKLLILFYIIFLVILFLMCFTDLIIREPEKEIYQVAVIIEDAGDDNYGNFRKGMDQAAIEYNADVHFITLYEKLNAEQQTELIDRERQDGADALIVAPVNEKAVPGAVSGKQGGIPVILLNDGETEEKTAGMVVIDYRKMGEQLGEQMKKHMPEECMVLVLTEPHGNNAANSGFLEGAEAVLEKSGYECRVMEPDGEEEYKEAIGTLPDGQAVILAESPEVLSETAEILAEDIRFASRILGLFGRGDTPAILSGLDRGTITGICVTDEFSRGYFSVRMAIEAVEGIKGREPLIMDSYYIEKKDLREPKYEKMLFPME